MLKTPIISFGIPFYVLSQVTVRFKSNLINILVVIIFMYLIQNLPLPSKKRNRDYVSHTDPFESLMFYKIKKLKYSESKI